MGSALFISLFLVFIFPSISYFIDDNLNEDAELVVGSFIENFNQYGETYDFGKRVDLINEFCFNGESTSIDQDIPNYPPKSEQIATYLRLLKQNKIKAEYDSDFTIERCVKDNDVFIGAYLNKTIVDPSGNKVFYRELFELRRKNEMIQVKSISSERIWDLNDLCNQVKEVPALGINQTNSVQSTQKYNPLNDKSFRRAEEYYKQQDFENALLFYQNVKEENPAVTPLVDERIDEIFSNEDFSAELVEKINSSTIDNSNQESSLELLEIAKNSEVFYSKTNVDIEEINQKIEEIKKNERVRELLEQGDYQMQTSNYREALNKYKEANRLKPLDLSITKKLMEVERKINSNSLVVIKNEIAKATNWIESSNYSKLEDALLILMKYDNNENLEGKHYFYMAQILDQKRGKAKKEFNLSTSDCCVKTKLFFIKAQNKGYKNSFTEYFWENHLNNRSRTCK